jgi:hypothetical protein
MISLIESLIAQRKLCGGDECRRRKCKRCARYQIWRRKHAA